MGFSYLDGKNWWEVTRDERFFCAHLMLLATHNGLRDLVVFLNENTRTELEPEEEWELGYEVCFYRDLWKLQRDNNKNPDTLYSPKRTFDLCLFSEKAIVVIEAKAQQNFELAQLKSFQRDEAEIKKVTGVDRVVLVGLVSSLAPLDDCARNCFADRCITWRELAAHYADDKVLLRADEIYEPDAVHTYGRNNTGGYMRGYDLLEAYQAGEAFWIGRDGGLSKFSEDIETEAWCSRRYETNRVAQTAPNANWFHLSDFGTAVEKATRPTDAVSDSDEGRQIL